MVQFTSQLINHYSILADVTGWLDLFVCPDCIAALSITKMLKLLSFIGW